MFFDSLFGLARILIIAISAYIILIICLRISGKRTLSKWNAFDFVVTIALGSTLATVILSKDVALIEGVLAFVLLIALQFIMTWLSVRSKIFEHLIKTKPTILFKEGQFLQEPLKAQRVTKSEILAAVRGTGCASLQDIAAVILETDGSFSVIRKCEEKPMSALEDVH